jgi:transposase, IS5 family
MLREHYVIDKRFEEMAAYFPKMDPALVKVDSYLQDEKLYRLIKKDLSKHWPKTKETGRNSTPVEVILRMLVVKRLFGYSYEETERNVSDSLNTSYFLFYFISRLDTPPFKITG